MLLERAFTPFDDPEWSFELKWDGWRAIADVTPKHTTIWTRHGNDVTHRFPELQALSLELGDRVILDGEICAFDERGMPQFDRVIRGPVTFVAFDVLHHRRRRLISKPLFERQRSLEQLVPQDSAHIIRSKAIHGEGVALFKQVDKLALEGIVAKRLASTYQPGIRSCDWLKIRTEIGNATIRKRLH
jgi:bifunctional non-homologous end joining protein LigD